MALTVAAPTIAVEGVTGNIFAAASLITLSCSPVTFADGHLWWAFAEPEVTWLGGESQDPVALELGVELGEMGQVEVVELLRSEQNRMSLRRALTRVVVQQVPRGIANTADLEGMTRGILSALGGKTGKRTHA